MAQGRNGPYRMKGMKRKWHILGVAAQAVVGLAVVTGKLPVAVGGVILEALRGLARRPADPEPEEDESRPSGS